MSRGEHTDDRTRQTYQRAGFGGAVEWGHRPAVLVVDFSRGFTDRGCSLGSDLTAEVESTRRVLNAARDADVPVIFTSIAFEKNLRDGGAWLRKVPSLGQLTVGSPWVELDPRLGARPEESIVYKRGPSAFFGTHLGSMLVRYRIDTVVVAGATTSGCVRASVVDSVQNGFQTFVINECVGDRASGPHEANLFDMAAKYADLVSVAEVIDHFRAGNRNQPSGDSVKDNGTRPAGEQEASSHG